MELLYLKKMEVLLLIEMAKIALAKLGMEDLSELTRIGGGRYASLTNDNQDIDSLLSARIVSSSESDQSLVTDHWK